MIFREGSNKASKGSPDITEGAGRGRRTDIRRDGLRGRFVRSFVQRVKFCGKLPTHPILTDGAVVDMEKNPSASFFILCSAQRKEGDEGSEAKRPGIHIFST